MITSAWKRLLVLFALLGVVGTAGAFAGGALPGPSGGLGTAYLDTLYCKLTGGTGCAISMPAVGTTAETLQTWMVSDSGSEVGISNATSTDSTFVPIIYMFTTVSSTLFQSSSLTANDTGTAPLMVFRVAKGTSNATATTPLSTRPAFSFANYTTVLSEVQPGGRVFDIVVTPAALAADQNNYALCTGAKCRLDSGAAARSITGIVPLASAFSASMDNLTLCAVGANTITLTNEDALSTAANRFKLPGAVNRVIAVEECVSIAYDRTSARWRMVN